jgi:hypothetical protein
MPRRVNAAFVLAVLLAAAPFVVAVIRVIRTGYDVRYFWVALAAFVGAALVMGIGRAGGQWRYSRFPLSAITFIVSTLAAVVVERLLGASAVFGVWAVATVFAAFFTASQVLFSQSRANGT